MHAPYFLILCHVALSTAKNSENSTKVEIENPSVNDIGNSLIAFLNVKDLSDRNARLDDLRAKLAKIDSYKIDSERFAEVLLNETQQTDVNMTNFFDALNEVNHFEKMADREKSLYLSLKEKMNRDDVLKILAEKGDEKVMKSARRMMDKDYIPLHTKEMEMDDVIDKLIAESPHDNHNFSKKDRFNKYWDPQKELEELKDHHRYNTRRLFKGERTTVLYYPFMVSINVMGRFWCGGVIYWHDIVLTSAACLQLMHNNRFFRENPRILAVRVGSNHSNVGGEVIDALEVFFHPSYNPRTLRNNIAVIRLRRHLKFTAERVIPKIIDIAHNSMGLPTSTEVLVLGWGVSKTSQKLAYEPVFLQRKFLPIYPNVFCKEIYGKKFVAQSMFCAGALTTGAGACDHDAGGPAILNGRLVGIISFGPAVCGHPNAPTVFTLVGAFANWIETINETMPTYYRGKKRTTTTTQFPIRHMFKRPGSQTVVQQKLRLEPVSSRKIHKHSYKTPNRTLKIKPVTPKVSSPRPMQNLKLVVAPNQAANLLQTFKADEEAKTRVDTDSNDASGTGDAEKTGDSKVTEESDEADTDKND